MNPLICAALAGIRVFATGGIKLPPYLIERITDADGEVIYKATRGKIPVLSPRAAKMTTAILEDVVSRGTAAGARSLGLRHRAAAICA